MRRSYEYGICRTPPINIPKPDHPEDIGRELSDCEIEALFKKCRDPKLRLQIEIALKTGMRLREMLGLKWEFINLECGVVKLPSHFTKTHKERVFPIARSIIERLKVEKKASRSSYVFPSRHSLLKPQTENKWAWGILKLRARVKCRWHDLRHTAATRKVRAGTPASIVSRELGMSEPVLLRIYNHVRLEDMRESAEAVKLPGER